MYLYWLWVQLNPELYTARKVCFPQGWNRWWRFFFSSHHLETKSAESLQEKIFMPKKTADVGLKAVEFVAVFSIELLLRLLVNRQCIEVLLLAVF